KYRRHDGGGERNDGRNRDAGAEPSAGLRPEAEITKPATHSSDSPLAQLRAGGNLFEPAAPSPSPLAGEGGEPAISAFTRVLDALWRASRVRGFFDSPLIRTLAWQGKG